MQIDTLVVLEAAELFQESDDVAILVSPTSQQRFRNTQHGSCHGVERVDPCFREITTDVMSIVERGVGRRHRTAKSEELLDRMRIESVQTYCHLGADDGHRLSRWGASGYDRSF